MPNQTTVTEFLLLEFSDVQGLQILHSGIFLVTFFAGLVGNFVIITAVVLDYHLHTPMYFFLINLSIIDMGSISVIMPKSIVNSLMNIRSISYFGCVTQVVFLISLVGPKFFLLTVMAYDHYVAICQPLHYQAVINRGACVQMTASARASGILRSAVNTGNTFATPFRRGNIVGQFFYEVPKLLKLSCSDAYLTETRLIFFSACLLLSCFILIIVSCVQIITTVLRIPSEQGQCKAFSTCLPHLTVLSLLVCTAGFAYLKPTFSSNPGLDLVLGVLYSVLPPVMNPIIYSMRNKEIKVSLKKLS